MIDVRSSVSGVYQVRVRLNWISLVMSFSFAGIPLVSECCGPAKENMSRLSSLLKIRNLLE